MSSDYKPAGYPSISPYLIVKSATQTIDFLTHAFHAVELRRICDSDGRVIHAEVRLADSVIMIADCAEGWPAVDSHVHVYVADVDDTYRLALAAGAESIQEPVKKDDEDKRGGVRDAGGTTWWIATRVG
jgi:PhnB protein